MASYLYPCGRCGLRTRRMEPTDETVFCEACEGQAAEERKALEAAKERDRKIAVDNERIKAEQAEAKAAVEREQKRSDPKPDAGSRGDTGRRPGVRAATGNALRGLRNARKSK